MPEKLPESALKTAEAAIAYAAQVRRYHARRTQKGDPQRETDIRVAKDRLKEAMKPLRSAIAKFPYEAQTDAAEKYRDRVRDLSEAIQRERRKLWKMQSR